MCLNKRWYHAGKLSAHAWKVCVPLTGTVGSNPTLSATNLTFCIIQKDVRIGLVTLWSHVERKIMKKLLGIVVLSLLWCNVGFAASYVFKDGLYTDCDILTKKDPTSFQKLSFLKEKKITFWDRRKQKSSGWAQSNFKAFIFKAEFEKSKDVFNKSKF